VTIKTSLAAPLLSLLLLIVSLSFNEETKASDSPLQLVTPEQSDKRLAYIVSDIRIPFWKTMGKGVQEASKSLGYEVDLYSAQNSAKHELENTVQAIRDNVSGIVLSPTTSSAASTILRLAKKAGIPVVISDIGSDSGEYISYISSDNKEGAYNTGKTLAQKMVQEGMQDKSVGIIAIPQKRANGQARTAGFVKALDEAEIKMVGIFQQVTFSAQETYDFSKEFINNNPSLGAIWLQGSDRYQSALDAIDDAGRAGEVLLICFDAEPEFLNLIPQGVLVGAAMQQPYLMGKEAVLAMDRHLRNQKVKKEIKLQVLVVSSGNITEQLETIKINVLGLITNIKTSRDAKN